MPVHPAADLVLSQTFYFYLPFPVAETATVNWLKTLDIGSVFAAMQWNIIGRRIASASLSCADVYSCWKFKTLTTMLEF